MHARPLLAAALLALALAGCGSDAPTTSAPQVAEVSASTAPSPSPTAATITRDAAAKQYLAIVSPFNALLDRNKKQCGEDEKFVLEGGSSFKGESEIMANLRKCEAALAKGRREVAAKLRAASWPAEVRADIEALAKADDAMAYAHEQSAKAATTDDWREVAFPKDDGAADIVRARLGLPTRVK